MKLPNKNYISVDFLDSYHRQSMKMAENIRNDFKKSTDTLIQLGDKIASMIEKGDAENVKPFLERIIQRGVKRQKAIGNRDGEDYNYYRSSYGHFRWNYNTVYTLNKDEMRAIIDYFKIYPNDESDLFLTETFKPN
jgi:N-methylhydantoinase B/oxoprolinase/acetone carboxylase alpha subunit